MAFIKYNNKYGRVDPSFIHDIYFDRDAGAAHEDVIVTPHEQWSDIRFKAANVQVCVNQQTRQLETRPPGDIWGWGGQWVVGDGFVQCDKWILQTEGVLVGKPLPTLHIRGNDFVNEFGRRVSLAGCDGFLDYRFWLDGGATALAPFVKESNELGFVVRRVFLAGSKKQNQVLDLSPKEHNFYPQLKPYVQYMNSNGIIPLLTVNVDMQDVMPVVGDRINNWNQIIAELKDSGLSYLISGGNEANKNGFDPYEIPDPGAGVWWSRGSKTQDDFYPPHGATATEFHPVRNLADGRTQMDAVASVYYMRKNGCNILWLDESYPFDNNDPSVEDTGILGRLYATYWAVVIFHNRQGQRGQLMGEGTRERATVFVKGMTL